MDTLRRLLVKTIALQPLLSTSIGLATLRPVNNHIIETDPIIHSQKILLNIKEYEIRRPNFWRSRFTQNPDTLAELAASIILLENAVLYGPPSQRTRTKQLLQDYLCACGNAYRYQGFTTLAVEYLSKAITLAQDDQDEPAICKALHLRGFTFFNAWTQRQQAEHNQHLLASTADFAQAQLLAQHIPEKLSLSVRTAILADGGRAQALSNTSFHRQQNSLDGMKAIDQAISLLTAQPFQQDPLFLQIDTDWCSTNMAEAYLANDNPDAALLEVQQITHGDPQARQRYFYLTIIEAEAHIAKMREDVGISFLETSLDALSETTSRRHLPRIIRLHDELQQDSRFYKSKELAQLGSRLLKLQYPALFH